MQQLISELGYLGLEVSDLPRWERFATEVLGFSVHPGRQANQRLLRMDEHRYRFLLSEGPADDCVFAGWQVPNAAAVEEFSLKLDAKGITWAWGTEAELADRMVQKMLNFCDPNGNRHEVYSGPALAADRFVSSKVATGFVTRGEGLGHVVYSSSAPAQAAAFAGDVLGLAISDQIRIAPAPGVTFEVTFFHVNSRHHSFALAARQPPAAMRKRIHHFMIEVGSVEEVGFARDRCLAMGQGVNMDIGQHPNDRMISFYGQTPSGFFVEFGYGGVKVDPSTWHAVTYDRLSVWGHRPNAEVPLKTAATAAPASSSSAAGTWNAVIVTPMGNDNVVFRLEIDGTALRGSIQGAQETNEIRDGRVDGNQLTWSAKVSSPMPMELQFNAAVEGDKITGGAKSPFGVAPFRGARA